MKRTYTRDAAGRTVEVLTDDARAEYREALGLGLTLARYRKLTRRRRSSVQYVKPAPRRQEVDGES